MNYWSRYYLLLPAILLIGTLPAGSQINPWDRGSSVNQIRQRATQFERVTDAFHRTLNRRGRGFERVSREAVRLHRSAERFAGNIQDRRNRGRNRNAGSNLQFSQLRQAFLATERSMQTALGYRPRSRSLFAISDAWSRVSHQFNQLERTLQGTPNRFRGNPGYNFNRGTQESVFRCESRNYRFRQCRVPGQVLDVRLLDRHSRARCVPGRTFGFRGNHLWVDDGCDGDFQVIWR